MRYNPKVKKILLSGKAQVDFSTFLKLIVQLTYLLYTCFLKKVNVFIGIEMLAKLPRRSDHSACQEVYIEFLLDKEFDRMNEAEQEIVSKKFKFVELTKSESSFGEYIC